MSDREQFDMDGIQRYIQVNELELRRRLVVLTKFWKVENVEPNERPRAKGCRKTRKCQARWRKGGSLIGTHRDCRRHGERSRQTQKATFGEGLVRKREKAKNWERIS
jgi:hypothetical protein